MNEPSIIRYMKVLRILFLLGCLLLVSCASPSQVSPTPGVIPPVATAEKFATEVNNAVKGRGTIPTFDHVVLIVLENHDYKAVIGSADMPNLNAWAKQYVLFTQYYAVSHPSLPNYLVLVGGSTFDITSDCTNCFLQQSSLADLMDESRLSWKYYGEGMPSPCFVGNAGTYMQKHNPFIYFDNIRTEKARCQSSLVPMTQLQQDLKNNQLPNFSIIMPDMCHSAHNCDLKTADQWLKQIVDQLQASSALGEKSMIFITFDEGAETNSPPCCGLKSTGGQVAAVMISPQAKTGFEDNTPLTHYSLLKTILRGWNLPDLGNTANPETLTIQDAWK